MSKLIISLALVALVAAVQSAPSVAKIDYQLVKTLETKLRANILVTMRERTEAALANVERGIYSTRGDRAQAVYDSLNALTKDSQKSVMEMLQSPRFFALTIKSFWISNQIYIQGADANLVELLAARDDIIKIDEEEIITIMEPTAVETESDNIIYAEWGVEKINAPAAWNVANGAGATVAVIDTGLRYTHNELSGPYKGDTHSWYNPYSTTANPGDGHGHGTHCSGTIVGQSGLGVAPGAQLISCKGLNDNGSGTNAGLLACGQFVLCPTTYTGSNADCSRSPDVSSNSWGGGTASTWFDATIRAWIAAGIVPVFANGNSGASCTTSLSPGDTSVANSIAVGATTTTDAIASFSSRGPSSRGALKPDVSAPGSAIVSAGISSNTARATMSGTSMATPHVAGVAALLRSANPSITVAQIKTILQNTAVRGTSGSQTCGGTPDTAVPNNTFGYGRVNALAAVNAARALMNN